MLYIYIYVHMYVCMYVYSIIENGEEKCTALIQAHRVMHIVYDVILLVFFMRVVVSLDII